MKKTLRHFITPQSAFIILVTFGNIVLGNKNQSCPSYIRLSFRRANKKRAFIINGTVSQFCGVTNDENRFGKEVNWCKTGSRLSCFMCTTPPPFHLLSFIRRLRRKKPRTGQRNRPPFEIFVLGGRSLAWKILFTYVCMRWLETKRNGLLNYYLIACDCRAGPSTVPWWTKAVVARLLVFANRIFTTRIFQSCAFVDV